MQKTVPGFAVLIPAAETFDTDKRCFAEPVLKRWIIGDLLHALGESIDIAIRNDEALLAVGEEVFCSSGCCCEDGASTCHRLTLDEC